MTNHTTTKGAIVLKSHHSWFLSHSFTQPKNENHVKQTLLKNQFTKKSFH